jgi:Flp pilus assembly protein TadG
VNLVKNCLDWIFAEDRRQAQRLQSLPLVAFYWDGKEPVAHAVLNISSSGLYLLTDQRWYPGTVVTVILQRAKATDTDPDRAISVHGKVVRSASDGVGLEFIWSRDHDPLRRDDYPAQEADLKTFKGFIKNLQADNHLHAQSGQALIEYILLLPMVFLLVVNIVNFGGFFFAWITVANAARAGADYAILGGASAGSPATPVWSQIQSVITQETTSLPNGSTVTINVCQNNQGTISALKSSGSTCGSIPSDPESSSYVLTSVTVSYTYKPFIAAFQFPRLGVYLTLPPTTITQQAVMRSIQ